MVYYVKLLILYNSRRTYYIILLHRFSSFSTFNRKFHYQQSILYGNIIVTCAFCFTAQILFHSSNYLLRMMLLNNCLILRRKDVLSNALAIVKAYLFHVKTARDYQSGIICKHVVRHVEYVFNRRLRACKPDNIEV